MNVLPDKLMELALIEAKKAGQMGEVPIGAILVDSEIPPPMPKF